MTRDVGIDRFQVESRRTQDFAHIIFRIEVLFRSDEGVVGLAVLALPRGGESTKGRVFRRLAENRPVFMDEPDFRIAGNDLLQRRLYLPAPGAVVVEVVDDRDITLRRPGCRST